MGKNKRLTFYLLLFFAAISNKLFAFEVDGICYEINQNGQGVVYVSKSTSDVQYVKLPSSVTYEGKTYLVTEIANESFANCTNLISIALPEHLESIGDKAFYGCSSLESITIPNSVTYIGDMAFYLCKNLDSLILEDGTDAVLSLDYGAFDNCPLKTITLGRNLYYKVSPFVMNYSLESVQVTSSVTSLGESLFSYCENLSSVSLPESLTKIGEYAFKGCASLKTIQLPNSVQKIGDHAFCYTGLTSVAFPESLDSIEAYVFSGCSNLESITIPKSIKWIGYWAFKSCKNLDSLIIEDDTDAVLSLDNSAFDNCPLKTITLGRNLYYKHCEDNSEYTHSPFLGNDSLQSVQITSSVTSLGKSLFSDCKNLSSVSLPESLIKIGASAFDDCTNLSSVSLPESLTQIGKSAFEGCASLKTIQLPNSVQKIGDHAFCYTGLTSVAFPESLDSIEAYVFSGCSNLESITIPKSIKWIGYWAFKSCKNLDSLIIEDDTDAVLSLDNSAFDNCPLKTITLGRNLYYKHCEDNSEYTHSPFLGNDSLQSVQITSSVTSLGKNLFYDCKNLSSISFPESLTEIGKETFSGCVSLKTIQLPNALTSIGSYAFSGCIGLVSVVLPESLKSIWADAFSGCTSLKSIVIPNSVTRIGPGAFSDCEKLTSIKLSESLESLDDGVFYGCSELKSVVIPNSVTEIAGGAFRSCIKLDSVSIGKSVSNIGPGAFKLCTSLQSITFPKSVRTIEACAFEWCDALTEVTSLAKFPPSLDSDAFDKRNSGGLNRIIATLYVPKEYVQSYKRASTWGLFSKIIGKDFTTTGMAEIVSENADCGYRFGNYGITFTKDGESVKIYTIQGTLFYSGKSSIGQTVELTPNAIYIIKVGEHATKVAF